ncbi:hypothetical protein Tco_0104662 [Tanacetum coccineum]
MYSAFVLDMSMLFCFFDDQLTNLLPNSCILPDVLLLGANHSTITRNAAWYKEKAMLAEAQEARQILDEEKLAFLADQNSIHVNSDKFNPHNAATRLRN